ncbi:helix-turn-helix domain-containing protein [Bacillus halotolerans]|uniref:helix-turn-helix domain-containing protein n=1 Tax=Bacillus halotolerans TaxID=260554 RepID=UPI002DB9E78C|nr:helix-turn-helix transcriptional regulator [Bacillus halotolerans]MEC1406656.1 helix-turn-helix transcriptional regulator [Bacillus halotolerans]
MNKNIGANIKKLREEKGYGLVQAAEGIGISRGYLSKLEKGTQYPSVKTIDKIAEFFSVDRSYFFTDLDNLDQFSEAEKEITFERDLSIENLRKKYNLTIEGKEVSDDEINVMLEVLKAYRKSKRSSDID